MNVNLLLAAYLFERLFKRQIDVAIDTATWNGV